MKVIDIEKVKTLFKLFQYGMPEDAKKAMDDDIAYLLEGGSIEIEQDKRRWIPVSESLPKGSDVNVLVQVSGRLRNIHFDNAFLLGNYSKDCGWIIDGYEEWVEPNVIAWMPLPEPYQE